MAYLFVLVIAAAAGLAVAFSTLRTGAAVPVAQVPSDAWTRSYEPAASLETEASAAPGAGSHARQPLPTDPTTHTKVVGVLGLAIAVLVAAGAIVGLFYAGVVVIKRAFA